MKKLIIPILMFSMSAVGQTIYQKDFTQFCSIINENYVYFDQQKIDWPKVREIYQPVAAKIKQPPPKEVDF